MKPHPKTGYEIWCINSAGELLDYAEGAIEGEWSKKVAVREFKNKYEADYGGFEYAVVKVQRRVVMR